MKFSFEEEKNEKSSSQDVEVSQEGNKFVTKEIFQTFSVLKIVYLTTLCLVLCIYFSVEDPILPIMVKLTGA